MFNIVNLTFIRFLAKSISSSLDSKLTRKTYLLLNKILKIQKLHNIIIDALSFSLLFVFNRFGLPSMIETILILLKEDSLGIVHMTIHTLVRQ